MATLRCTMRATRGDSSLDTPEKTAQYRVFDTIDKAAWEAKVKQEFGVDGLARLRRKNGEGMELETLYMEVPESPFVDSLPGQGSHVRGSTALGCEGGSWRQCQEYRIADFRRAASVANDDVKRGAGGACFTVDTRMLQGGVGESREDAPRSGLVLASAEDANAFVEALDPSIERQHVWIESGAGFARIADWFAGTGVTVLADPLGILARTGALGISLDSCWTSLANLVEATPAGQRCLLASACVFEDAGASDGLALAGSLSCALDYIRVLERAGIRPERSGARLRFRVSMGRDFFAGIAKIRALRLLWAKIACASGMEDGSTRIHARSSWHEWAQKDPWANLLRGTVGSFAAVLGGADSIATRSFDELNSDGESALGRRLACNTQVLLREESYTDKVIDPAGGSYYVEQLSESLARSAWSHFQAIEAMGGMSESLRSGALRARVGDDADARREAFASRRRPVIGVSKYAQTETESPSDPSGAVVAASPQTSVLSEQETQLRVEKITSWRGPALFEALQAALQAHAPAPAPSVFLVHLGTISAYQARLDFVVDFFACAGIQVSWEQGEGEGDLRNGLEAFVRSGAKIVCFCGQDSDYMHVSQAVCLQFQQEGALELYLAGRRPKTGAIEALTYVGQASDALALLQATLTRCGVKECG